MLYHRQEILPLMFLIWIKFRYDNSYWIYFTIKTCTFHSGEAYSADNKTDRASVLAHYEAINNELYRMNIPNQSLHNILSYDSKYIRGWTYFVNSYSDEWVRMKLCQRDFFSKSLNKHVGKGHFKPHYWYFNAMLLERPSNI